MNYKEKNINTKCAKVSIVVSIYNVEKYLERCLNSLINQTMKDIEILLIDDGSQDKCPQICDYYAQKDSRIKVIHKENEGLGMARNTGIDNATGDYICFFDSDDYIALDAIEKTYNLAIKEMAEIVIYGFAKVNRNNEISESIIPNAKKKIFEGQEVQNEFLPDLIANNPKQKEKNNFWMSAWASLYSRELIMRQNWKFVSERKIIAEDVYSLLNLYSGVKKVAILSEPLYYYCENDNSLTHTYRKDRYDKIKIFYEECINVCNKLEYSKEIELRLVYPFLSYTIAALKQIAVSDVAEKKKEIQNVIQDNIFQENIKKIHLDNETISRKIFITCAKMKKYNICYWLIKLKSK